MWILFKTTRMILVFLKNGSHKVLVGLVGCNNLGPSPWRKQFFVLDQQSVGAKLEQVFSAGGQFFAR